jgi:GH15 family glucan-1,4-alpha-glucosidase
LSSVVLLALVYAGLRLFGDQQILEILDAFEARLLVGLERLRLYLQSF